MDYTKIERNQIVSQVENDLILKSSKIQELKTEIFYIFDLEQELKEQIHNLRFKRLRMLFLIHKLKELKGGSKTISI